MRHRRFLVFAALLLCGCGGGGTNNNNNPPPPVLLAASRYFPSPIGAHYVYESAVAADTFGGLFDTEFEYAVEVNPLGSGVYYNAVDQNGFKRGPVFSGLEFSGLNEEDAALSTIARFETGPLNQADVLPAGLSEIGDTWDIHLQLGHSGTPFITTCTIDGTATAAALEDVSLGATTFEDCLRVDASFSYQFLSLAFPAFEASYWLAPDVGPVEGALSLAGVEVARVRLVSVSIP